VLEKRFRLLAPTMKGAPCRLDGVLDLEQFTRIVVDCILYYNSRHRWRMPATRRRASYGSGARTSRRRIKDLS
jgi:hypothetical protein